MARLLLLPLWLSLLTVSQLGVAPAAAAKPGVQNDLLFNMLPRPRLHEVSLDSLESALDVLTDLLEERVLPSGEKGFRLSTGGTHTVRGQ